MKREILFRGKRIDNGEWIASPNYSNIDGNISIGLQDDGERKFTRYYQVLPETVGQFTGLTDKNGTKIFEGDILYFHFLDEDGIPAPDEICIETVEFINGAFCTDCDQLLQGIENSEFIGNIHDNPELIPND